MNDTPQAGHNNPPSDIDDILAPYGDDISEAEGWLDGTPVASDGQMDSVDSLLATIKAAAKEIDTARDEKVKPLNAKVVAERARWKPTQDDLARIKRGLISIVGDYRKKKAAEAEEERRRAFVEAEKIRKEAAEKARQAEAGNLEEQRAAAELQAKADDAQKAARKVETVKGLRKVTKFEIMSHKEALHWIAANDREAMTLFIEEYVRINHKAKEISGVRVWDEKQAF